MVKLIVIEDGSDVTAELWNTGQPAASSVLSYPEGRAALAAARRGRRLTPAGYRRALADFELVRRELAVIGVDEALAEHAGDLASEAGLRRYDAVHLASAMSLGVQATCLVTWDGDLREAADLQGFAVAPAD